MSRRGNRKRRREERIRDRRVKETAEKLRACAGRDACDHPDCVYFPLPEEILELIAFVDEVLENKGENACAFDEREDGKIE